MEGLFDKLTDYVAYARLWQFLDKTHTSEQKNYLMVCMVEIEEEVSAYYGLPLTFNYSEIFQELGVKEDFRLSDIYSTIERLEQAAKEHFNRPVVSDLELLKIAQQSQIDIEYVLPELTLKLLAEPYYIFCYFFLFLPKKTTPELFLQELKIVVKNNCSMLLSNIVNKHLSDYSNDSDYLLLQKFRLQFLDLYLADYHNFDHTSLAYLENGLPF